MKASMRSKPNAGQELITAHHTLEYTYIPTADTTPVAKAEKRCWR
jgi:hypothetical protein